MSQNTPLTREIIHSWPKAELHCHLDGSLRLSTMLELAQEQGKMDLLPAKTEKGLQEVLLQVDDSPTLEAYLSWFSYTIPLMQTPEAIRRIAYELAADNAAENVRYLEVRYAPITHTWEGMDMVAVNEAVLDGLAQAEQDFDIKTGVIICGLRDRYESASLAQAELAVAFKGRGVVGFDLAGGEAGHPPKHHLFAFYHAINNLLNITVHAGESWGPDSIKQAVTRCHAHRIGHGTSLYQDPELLQFMLDHQIPLEICPTSNVQTHVVPSFEEHPLKKYVDVGLPVTINTDNRLFSRTSVTEELWRVHHLCGVSESQLKEIVLNGFRHAFLPEAERQVFVKRAMAGLYRESKTPQYI